MSNAIFARANYCPEDLIMIFSFLNQRLACFCLLFLVLFGFLISCDFHSDEEYFQEVTAPDSSGLKIDLQNLNEGDTIRLFTDTKVNLSRDAAGKTIKRVMVFINEKPIGYTTSSLSPIPYIDFQANNYVNGIYDLKVVLVAGAGTGSLADSKGLEEITRTHHYVVVVDKTPPLTLQVIAQVEDGMLRIRWPQHVRKNFQKYILTKTYSISRDVYNQCWSMDITSQQQTLFSDSTYVGGKVRYSLQVKAADLLSTPTTASFELNYSPDINTVWMNKDQVKLVWRKNPLFRSLSQYKITLRSSSATPFAIFNTQDTTAVVANRFLFPANRARIDIIPKGKECPSSNPYQEKIIIMGEPFPAFKDANIRYSIPFSKYFAMRDNETQYDLMRISEQGAIEQYITLSDDHFYLSPDGRLMYTAIGSILSQIDPLTFTVMRFFDLRNLVAGSSIGVVGGAVSISNDNRIAITTSKGNFVLDASFAVLKSSAQDTKMTMSASGNSLVTNNALWLWDGSTYVMKYSQFPINSYFGFRGDQYVVITSSDNNLVKLLDTTTLVLETSSSTAFISGPGSYDPVSGWSSRLAADASDLNILVLVLYSPDGSTVRKIPVQWGDMNRGFATVLSNNHIICSTGYSLPLSFYYP